jgi:tetratricopeptide (TPR) repeat protein
VLARRGDFTEAEDLAREAVERANRIDQVDTQAEAHVDLAEVLRLAGRRREAQLELARAADLYELKGNSVAETSTRKLLLELRS